MKKAALAITAVLLLVLATACGGGKSTSSSKPTGSEKAVITSVAQGITSTNGLLDPTQATCVATKFVTSVGVKKLQSAKAVGADDLYIPNGANVDADTSAAYTKALLSCVKESDALTKLQASSEAGYAKQTAGILAQTQVHCLISKFTTATGVAKLFSSGFVSDAGAFNGEGSAYDNDTAENFADALVNCVDYPKLQAQDAVAAAKKKHVALNLAKMTTCLRQRIPEAEVKATIVARLTGAANTEELLATTKTKTEACAKVSKK